MEELEGQVKYLKQYIQRQENLLLDYIRKCLDFELKFFISNISFQEISTKYEESQKQVEIQNDLMQQAAEGVKTLTNDKKIFEQKEIEFNKIIDDLKKSLNAYKEDKEKINQKYEQLKKDYDICDKKYKDLEIEYKRQTEELSNLYNKKVPINKRNKQTVKLPPDEF